MRPEIGDPLEHLAVLLLLDRVFAQAHVRILKGHCTAHGVEVVSVSA